MKKETIESEKRRRPFETFLYASSSTSSAFWWLTTPGRVWWIQYIHDAREESLFLIFLELFLDQFRLWWWRDLGGVLGIQIWIRASGIYVPVLRACPRPVPPFDDWRHLEEFDVSIGKKMRSLIGLGIVEKGFSSLGLKGSRWNR